MDSITPQTFLETLYPPDLLLPDERPVVAWPDSFIDRATGRKVDYYVQRHPVRRMTLPHGAATYFCVSTVLHQRKRQVRKSMEEVRTAMVLAVDDVGTKSAAPPVPPSYILETSPGNFQFGYLLEPFDVSTPQGQADYDVALYSLAEAGMNDPGFRSATRLARLPGSLHRTGFRAQITSWEPDRVWELDALMARMDVPLTQPRKLHALQPGKYTQLEDVVDPLYHQLCDLGLVLGHNARWVHIECPWRHTHTDGAQGSSSTAYSPLDYGAAGRGFKCLHGHCASRGLDDFITEIARRLNR